MAFFTLTQLSVSGGGSASATTASVTPTAGRTQFVFVSSYNVSGAASPPVPTSVAGAGLTFSLVTNWITGPGGAGFGEIQQSVWVVTSGTPTSGGITITCPGGSVCVFGALVVEVSALTTTVRQTKLGNTSPGTSTSISATTDVATLSSSGMLGFWFNYDNNTTTPNWSNGYNIRDTSLGDWGISFNATGSDTGSVSEGAASNISILVLELQGTPPSFVPDEDYWQGPAPARPAPNKPAFTDDDVWPTPPPPFFGDEDFWQNPVAPVQARNVLRLPFLDPEMIPAGNLKVLKFDVDPWRPDFAWRQARPPVAGMLIYDAGDLPVSVPTFVPDEDFWAPLLLPQAPRQPPLVLFDAGLELLPTGTPPFVVSSQQTAGTGTFSPSTLTFTCAAGDTLLFFVGWWNFYHDSNAGGGSAPSDSNGTVVDAYDQWTPDSLPSNFPPVYGQSWAVYNCAAGSHVITAPSMHADGGVDGTFYVIQVRNLKTTGALRVTGHQRSIVGSHQTGNTVALDSACQLGDFVVALSLYDNTTPFGPPAGYTDPPSGWTSAGVQQASDVNVPSELAWRLAPAADTESVSWTWSDTGVNVTAAIILAFIPLSAPDTLAAGVFAENGQAALFQGQMVAAAGATTDAGQAAAFTAALAAAAGGTTEAGQGASFQTSLVASAGATTELGEAAAFQAQLVASAGGTVDTFADAGGVMATVGPSAGGTFAETGQAATFTSILAADAGGTVDSFSQAGGAGGSTADGATFTESGQPATFRAIMAAAAGGTLEAGQSAAFRTQMPADVGGAVDAGQDAAFVVVLHAQGGVFAETFSQATDIHPPLPTVDYRADVVDIGPAHPVAVADLGPRYRVTIKEVL